MKKLFPQNNLPQESKSAPSLSDSLNRPLHDLRISVIDQCNLRCPYCMPADEYTDTYTFLKKNEWISFEEITRLVKIFTGLGVTKIRITGGEPLIRKNLHELIAMLNSLNAAPDLALTTNGILLAAQASALKKAVLKRLTISLDTLDEKVFALMSGNRGSIHQVLEGIRVAQEAGFESIKINTVIQRGVNDHTFMDLVSYFHGTKHILRFIEFMDVGNRNHWKKYDVVSSSEIIEQIRQVFPLKDADANYFGEVAERYIYEDGQGELGFISSVSQPFCGSCTRARLSTDGKLYTCLFASKGTDLRQALREKLSDEELSQIISQAWQKRTDRYSEDRYAILASNPNASKKIEMYQIGG